MNFKNIQLNQQDNGILQINLNRPEKLNALNQALVQELYQALSHAQCDKAVKALLLTGSGDKAFCAGADIREIAELNTTNGYDFAKRGQYVFRLLEQMGKPSLAAVNGFAFGGGCELAMATTLRIASNKAQFGQPEVKLGIMPGYGGTQRLARLIGKGRALDLCITGRTINADTALSYGLVTEITDAEKLLPRAEEILVTILAMAPKAVASCLKVIDAGYDISLDEALELEASHFGLCCGTQDKQEGVNAFLEKRAAKFADE